MDIEYSSTECNIKIENNSQFVTYGIVAVNKMTEEKLAEFPDVSLSKDFVVSLTGLLNSCGVELCHFFDVVTDEINR